MKKFRVTIPYYESTVKTVLYNVDFEILAENHDQAKEKAMKKFDRFLEFNLASWVRIPMMDKIHVEYLEEVKEPDPWSYL